MRISKVVYSQELMKCLNNAPSLTDQGYDYIGLAFKNFRRSFPYFDVYRVYFKADKINFCGFRINFTSDNIEDKLTIEDLNTNRRVTLFERWMAPIIRFIGSLPRTITKPSFDFRPRDLEFSEVRGDLDDFKGFTLFTDQVVDLLAEYSNFVALSGKAVEYGRMAYDSIPNDGTQKYFGLKMEGDMDNIPDATDTGINIPELRYRIDQLNNSDGQIIHTGVMKLTGGLDCPPLWEPLLYRVIESNLMRSLIERAYLEYKLDPEDPEAEPIWWIKLYSEEGEPLPELEWDNYKQLMRAALYEFLSNGIQGQDISLCDLDPDNFPNPDIVHAICINQPL